jgi:hypothetical protein
MKLKWITTDLIILAFVLLIAGLMSACGQDETTTRTIAGKDGTNGVDGNTGAAGNDGSRGEPGVQGAEGLAGPQGPQGEAGETGAQGEAGAQGDVGTAMRVVSRTTCTTLVPNFNAVKVQYVLTAFSTEDAFVQFRTFDDDREFGGGSDFQAGEVADGKIVWYYDKQQNDDWGEFEFSVDEDLEFTIEYRDPVDADEAYILPDVCEKVEY